MLVEITRSKMFMPAAKSSFRANAERPASPHLASAPTPGGARIATSVSRLVNQRARRAPAAAAGAR
jgi:hypothetical protein